MIEACHLILAPAAIGLLGWGLVRWLTASLPDHPSSPPLKACFALITGLGIWSASYSTLLFAHITGTAAFFIKDLMLLTLGAALTRIPLPSPPPSSPFPPAPRWIKICTCLTVGLAALLLILQYLRQPDGAWDAWGTWNLRARFLHRAPEDLLRAFSPHLHWETNYPLMLPGLIAQTWTLLGFETTLVPAVVGGIYGLAILGLLGWGLQLTTGKKPALMALILLAGTPMFIILAGIQYADILVAAYVLMAWILTHQVISKPSHSHHPRLYLAIGLALSMAIWTKNDGVLHALALGFILLASCFPNPNPFQMAQKGGWLVVGASPLLLLTIWFKTHHATVNLFLVSTPSEYLHRCLDFERWKILLSRLFLHLGTFDRWNLFFWMILAAWILLLFCFRKISVSTRWMALSTFLAWLIIGVAILASPFELVYQIETALDRGLAQVWPCLVAVTFLAIPALSIPSPTSRYLAVGLVTLSFFAQLKMLDHEMTLREKPILEGWNDERYKPLIPLIPPKSDVGYVSDAPDTLVLATLMGKAQYALAPRLIITNQPPSTVVVDLVQPAHIANPEAYCSEHQLKPIQIFTNGVILAESVKK